MFLESLQTQNCVGVSCHDFSTIPFHLLSLLGNVILEEILFAVKCLCQFWYLFETGQNVFLNSTFHSLIITNYQERIDFDSVNTNWTRRNYFLAKLENVTDMADISVYKYWNVGVKSVGDQAILLDRVVFWINYSIKFCLQTSLIWYNFLYHSLVLKK